MIPISDSIPTRRFPFMTILLILINVVVFVYEMLVLNGGGDNALQQTIVTFGVVPARVADGAFAQTLITFVTSMFLHASILHIAGNMLYLWIFGNNIEDVLGHFWFTVFYFACGFAASAAQVVMSWGSTLPGIGASGAIAGVLAAYLIFFPRSRINTLLIFGFFIMFRRLPAIIVLGLWFVIQLVQGFLSFGQTQSGGVAFFAHIGGFVAGLILALPWLAQARRIGARVLY
jgi:membrane associated rhomboid family serine protease